MRRNPPQSDQTEEGFLLTFWNACPAAPRWHETHVFARPVLGAASVLPSSSLPEMRVPPTPASSSLPEICAPLRPGGAKRAYSLVVCSVELP